MAAPTVTRAITSTVHTITVTSTGGAGITSSIAQVYTALIAYPNVMTYEIATNTYTLHALTATYVLFNINANCTVQIPQDTTFINQGYPATAAGSGNVFYLYANGKLILNPGSRIKFSQSGGYVQLYGAISAVGTKTKPIIWQSYRNGYMYCNTEGEEARFQWVTFKNISGSSYYWFYFSQYNQYRARPIIFKNVKFRNDSQDKWGYPFYFTPGGMYSNVQVDGFQCDYTSAIVIYGCSVKLKNGLIKNNAGTNITIQGGGNVVSPAYQTSKDDTTFPTGRFQSMVVLQNIQFDNIVSASTYAIQAYYNSLVYVKNCKFSARDDIIYRALYSRYGSVIIQNNNDITALSSNSSRKVWGAEGTILHGHQLDLTVLDQNNHPVNEATVTVIQKSDTSKQRWSGLTNEYGKLLTVYNDNPVYIQKEQTSLNNFLDWSDPGHTLMVNKSGYKPSIQDLSFTENKTVVVNLQIQPDTIDIPGLQIGQGIVF